MSFLVKGKNPDLHISTGVWSQFSIAQSLWIGRLWLMSNVVGRINEITVLGRSPAIIMWCCYPTSETKAERGSFWFWSSAIIKRSCEAVYIRASSLRYNSTNTQIAMYERWTRRETWYIWAAKHLIIPFCLVTAGSDTWKNTAFLGNPLANEPWNNM